jgi:hypothetical protein
MEVVIVMRLIQLFETKRFVRSMRSARYTKLFDRLPKAVQERAQEYYKKWWKDPASIEFRPLNANAKIWRASLPEGYRAMGEERGDTIVWFWIGSHSDYNNMIKKVS